MANATELAKGLWDAAGGLGIDTAFEALRSTPVLTLIALRNADEDFAALEGSLVRSSFAHFIVGRWQARGPVLA